MGPPGARTLSHLGFRDGQTPGSGAVEPPRSGSAANAEWFRALPFSITASRLLMGAKRYPRTAIRASGLQQLRCSKFATLVRSPLATGHFPLGYRDDIVHDLYDLYTDHPGMSVARDEMNH